jgi:endonuclease-3
LSSVESVLAMDEKQLAELIYPVGFYNTKAKNIKKAAAILLDKWGGEVPVTESDLTTLPGAAASCVTCPAF